MLSEVLAHLLGSHQEFLLGNLRWRCTFGLEGELKIADDLIDDLRVFNEGDDPHLSSASRTEQRVCLIKGEPIERKQRPYHV